MKKQVWNFVLTGGPSAGKTTGLSIMEQSLENRGYYVLIVPETATEVIPTGIRPFNNSLDILTFQYIIFEKQLHKEELYRKVAQMLSAEKVVIIHDRGLIDNKSYISDEQFKKLLSDFSLNEVTARDRYDAVFHLVTAADGAEEFYTLENNPSRTETPEEARNNYYKKITGNESEKPVLPNGEEIEGTIDFIHEYPFGSNFAFYITIDGVDYEEVAYNVKGVKQLFKAKAGDKVKVRVNNGKITEVISVNWKLIV